MERANGRTRNKVVLRKHIVIKQPCARRHQEFCRGLAAARLNSLAPTSPHHLEGQLTLSMVAGKLVELIADRVPLESVCSTGTSRRVEYTAAPSIWYPASGGGSRWIVKTSLPTFNPPSSTVKLPASAIIALGLASRGGTRGARRDNPERPRGVRRTASEMAERRQRREREERAQWRVRSG